MNPVDETTIAVCDRSELLFYDRRMLSSASVNRPAKVVDASLLDGDEVFIVQLKYDPSGRKLIFTNSCGFNTDQYALDTRVGGIRKFTFRDRAAGAVTKVPSFLGENYVLFDVFYKNYSAVFDLEDMRYMGTMKFFKETNFFSNGCSMPHPHFCLVASTNNNFVSLTTPTSSG